MIIQCSLRIQKRLLYASGCSECLKYISKQNRNPCPHGDYMVKMKKMIMMTMMMMIMIIILKMVPALWDLKSMGGNKVSFHVAMASPWDICSLINVPAAL